MYSLVKVPIDQINWTQLEEFLEEAFPEDVDNILNQRIGYVLLAIDENEKVIGVLLAGYERSRKSYFIYALAVLVKNKGIGSALLETMINEHKNSSIMLYVRPSNEVAIKLYEKYSFVPVDLVKKFYGNGEDAIMMKRSF